MCPHSTARAIRERTSPNAFSRRTLTSYDRHALLLKMLIIIKTQCERNVNFQQQIIQCNGYVCGCNVRICFEDAHACVTAPDRASLYTNALT